jgi:hypothetical protein
MRRVVPALALCLSFLTLSPVCAFSRGVEPTQKSIEALEARANQALPRDQCYLYAELVQQMTELSIRQYAAGDVSKATNLLQKIRQLAQKIHLTATDKDKRLKNAQLMLSHTAFRLKEMLHASNLEDRPLFEQTLAQVNQAQKTTMLQLFGK